MEAVEAGEVAEVAEATVVNEMQRFLRPGKLLLRTSESSWLSNSID